jgi:hypothetical protein
MRCVTTASSNVGLAVAPRQRSCGIAAQTRTHRPESLAVNESDTYLRHTLRCSISEECRMIAFIERALDAFFAPLARELERLPPQALRYTVFF